MIFHKNNSNIPLTQRIPEKHLEQIDDVKPKKTNLLKNLINRVFGKDLTNIENVPPENLEENSIKKKVLANTMKIGVKLPDNLAPLKTEENAEIKEPQKELNFTLKTKTVEINLMKEEEVQPKDPQEVDEYFDDIVEELFENEKKFLPDFNYMNSIQKDISNHMRSILNDWLVLVHLKYKMKHETLFLAINYLDRYLSKVNIKRDILQLVGITSLMIAGKYEEIYPPELNDYSYITDDTYTVNEIKDMECKILGVLNFDTTITTPYRFLQIYKKLLNFSEKAFIYAEYLLDLSTLDVKMNKFLPSEVAAAAAWLAIRIIEKKNLGKEIIIYSRSTEEIVRSCKSELMRLLLKYDNHSLKACKQKYSQVKFQCVAKIKISEDDNKAKTDRSG